MLAWTHLHKLQHLLAASIASLVCRWLVHLLSAVPQQPLLNAALATVPDLQVWAIAEGRGAAAAANQFLADRPAKCPEGVEETPG